MLFFKQFKLYVMDKLNSFPSGENELCKFSIEELGTMVRRFYEFHEEGRTDFFDINDAWNEYVKLEYGGRLAVTKYGDAKYQYERVMHKTQPTEWCVKNQGEIPDNVVSAERKEQLKKVLDEFDSYLEKNQSLTRKKAWEAFVLDNFDELFVPLDFGTNVPLEMIFEEIGPAWGYSRSLRMTDNESLLGLERTDCPEEGNAKKLWNMLYLRRNFMHHAESFMSVKGNIEEKWEDFKVSYNGERAFTIFDVDKEAVDISFGEFEWDLDTLKKEEIVQGELIEPNRIIEILSAKVKQAMKN